MNRKGMLKYPLVRSDDKKAISKLQANLDILQKKHERLKMENEYYKEHGTLMGCPGVPDGALGMRNNLAVKVRYRLGSRNC